MATPPSMANEPAASEATPLVTMLEVALLVALGVAETRVVMVVLPPAVVVELLRTVDGATVDDGVTDDEAALVEVAAEVLPLLVALPVALLEALLEALPVDEALALPEAEVVLLLPAAPPVILKGKPYWKMVVSDSRVMMMP